MRILDAAAVRQALPMPEAIEAMKRAFAAKGVRRLRGDQ